MNPKTRSHQQQIRRYLIQVFSATCALLLAAAMAVIGWQLFPRLLQKDW